MTDANNIDHSDTGSKTIDDSRQYTELCNEIYQLLVKSQTITGSDGKQQIIDVLKSDFNNAKLRNIFLMLLLANGAELDPNAALLLANSEELDPNVAFILQSDNPFALRRQLRVNNGGIVLPDEQNLSFKKQNNFSYVNLLSVLKIQSNDLIFVYKRDAKSFEKIVEIVKKHGLKLPKELEYSTKTDTEKEKFINAQIQLTENLCQQYDKSLKDFIECKDITKLKSFIDDAISSLGDVIQIFNFIQNKAQKEELKSSVNQLVGKFNGFTQSLYSNPELKGDIELKKQLEEKIPDLEEKIQNLEEKIQNLEEKIQNLEEKIQKLKNTSLEQELLELQTKQQELSDLEQVLEEKNIELQTKNKELLDLNKLSHIQIFDKIQIFNKQWNEVQRPTTEKLPQFQIFFDTRDKIKYCKDSQYEELAFIPDNDSYSDFILQIMLPIIHQLAFTGIQKTNPELITKIISGNYNKIVQQRIAQLLNDALQNHQTLPELTLNNLLDENLVKVYDRAKLFIGSEEHPLTDEQKNTIIEEISEIARTTENLEVLKAIMKQKCFKSNLDIISVIAKNEKSVGFILHGCAKAIGKIAKTLTDENKKIKAINILDKIAQNPKVHADTLDSCATAIGKIAKTLTDENEKIKAINILDKIAQKPEAQRCTLCYCAEAIRKITKTLTDEGNKIKAINILDKIAQNNKAGVYALASCAITIIEIVPTLKNENKITAINILYTIAQNEKSDTDTLSNCATAIGKIAETLKNEDKIKAINILYKIAKNEKSDADTLSNCATAIGKIAETLKNEDKIKAINILYKIAKNNKANARTLGNFTTALGKIAPTLTDEDKKMKALNTIFIIAQNEKSDGFTLYSCADAIKKITPNLTDEDKKMKAIIILYKIAQNEKSIGLTLYSCATAIEEIAKTLKNSDLKKIVNGTIEIINEMQQSIQIFQTIQNIPEKTRQQFQDKINEINEQMKKIREEEENKILTDAASLFDLPEATSSSSSLVNEASTTNVSNTSKTPTEKQKKQVVVGEKSESERTNTGRI